MKGELKDEALGQVAPKGLNSIEIEEIAIYIKAEVCLTRQASLVFSIEYTFKCCLTIHCLGMKEKLTNLNFKK